MGVGVDRPWLLFLVVPASLVLIALIHRVWVYRGWVYRYMGGRLSRGLTLFEVLRLLSIILLIVASAGIYTTQTIMVPVEGVGYGTLARVRAVHLILVDDSKSMGGDRISIARDIVRMYLQVLGPGDHVIIYRFYGGQDLLCNGTPIDCMSVVDGLRGDMRYTDIGSALGLIQSYSRSSGIPVVGVLISDGGNNYGPDPMTVARGMDLKSIALVRVGDDPRGGIMEAIAKAKEWKYYHISGKPSKDLIRDLAETLYTDVKALAVASGGLIPVEEASHAPSLILGFIALLMLMASMVYTP